MLDLTDTPSLAGIDVCCHRWTFFPHNISKSVSADLHKTSVRNFPCPFSGVWRWGHTRHIQVWHVHRWFLLTAFCFRLYSYEGWSFPSTLFTLTIVRWKLYHLKNGRWSQSYFETSSRLPNCVQQSQDHLDAWYVKSMVSAPLYFCSLILLFHLSGGRHAAQYISKHRKGVKCGDCDLLLPGVSIFFLRRCSRKVSYLSSSLF